MRRFTAIGLLAGMLLAAGCNKVMTGRVVEGSSSTAVIVSAADERFQDPGVAGIEVELLTARGEPLGRSVSNDEGDFRVPIDPHYSGKFRVRSHPDAYENLSTTVFVPTGDRRLLILLEPVEPLEENGG